MNYLEWAKENFQKDIYAMETTGIELVEVNKDYAKCRLPLSDKHMNAAGSVMGGAIFTLADFTFAVAANAGNPLTVSLSSQISFLSPGKGNFLTAEAICIKNGNTTCCYEIKIMNDEDILVASVTATGFRVRG